LCARRRWLTPVILATQDRGSKPAQANSKIPNTKKRAGGVAQIVEYYLASLRPQVQTPALAKRNIYICIFLTVFVIPMAKLRFKKGHRNP
jgi:hypothetical protein